MGILCASFILWLWWQCLIYTLCDLFSLQPVRDTREKQIQLWKELILDYCKTQKIFVIGLEEEFPLFSNPVIESKWHVVCMIYKSCLTYVQYALGGHNFVCDRTCLNSTILFSREKMAIEEAICFECNFLLTLFSLQNSKPKQLSEDKWVYMTESRIPGGFGLDCRILSHLEG